MAFREHHTFSGFKHFVIPIFGLLANLVLINVSFRKSDRIAKVIGTAGLRAFSKITSLLLAVADDYEQALRETDRLRHDLVRLEAIVNEHREQERTGAHRLFSPFLNSISRITLAGAPAAIVPGGRSWVTTEFAPTTQRSPIVTPPVTTQLTPNQQLEPIRTGPRGTKPCHVTGTSGSS